MSPTSQTRSKEDNYMSELSDGCVMYSVYCSVEIPPEKISLLDKIIIQSRKGLQAADSTQTGETTSVYGALIFMNSDVSSTLVERGSHLPMRPFPSYPWAGKSLHDIYSYFRESSDQLVEQNPGEGLTFAISLHNFAVIDERTLEDGTLLLCSDTITRGDDEDGPANTRDAIRYGLESDPRAVPEQLTTLRSDAYSSVVCLSGAEAGKLPLLRYESLNKKNRQFVFTKEYANYDDMEYLAQVRAKAARGEPLRDIEKEITGLDNVQD